MADNLPEPKSRKESYLAKAAGMDVTIPEAPESRTEQYLAAIAEGGGGGGTSDFDELTNRPKYNGTAMTSSTDIPASPTVVQTTGNSTTDVMSQDATTKMIYNDINRKEIKITGDGSSTASKIAIGSSNIDGSYGIAIGWGGGAGSSSTQHGCISIGYGAYPNGPKAYGNNSVAIGAGSYTNAQGVFAIGGNSGFTGGYNNSAYRLLTGVYDGQSAHDAATVGQALGETESYTIASGSWSALSSSDPYTFQATVTATHTISASTVAELLNDAPVTFATYGFAIGSISGQSVTFYSIGQPSASVTLKVNYKG